jgi:hypothetical protein
MTTVSNKPNQSISITMDLEKLQQEYTDLLIKYKAAVTDYILFLQNNPTNTNQFVTIQGQSYVGTGSAGTSNATTLQDCTASCSSNAKCTGATFISNKCDIRIGDTDITPSSQNSYAIIPKQKQMLMNMEDINSRLLAINKEINDKIQIYQPQFYKNNEEGKQRTQQLIQNYEVLTKERESLIQLLRENETLDTTDNENQIKINQNYYSYILFTLISIVVIYVLFKMSFTNNSYTTQYTGVQYGGDINQNAYYIVFSIILIIIMINYFYR